MFRRFIIQPLMLFLAFVLVLGSRYYYFVAFEDRADGEFSKVGIGIHSLMPDQVRMWGCEKLTERFPTDYIPDCK